MNTEIAQIIREAGGRVPFARFMELALTHPREGYYARAQRILGRRGDFSTAPLLSPEFNEAVATLVEELVRAALQAQAESGEGANSETDSGLALGAERLAVVELGGGEGHLAQAILGSWQKNLTYLRDKLSYSVVEVGEGLREKQREKLNSFMQKGWDIRWGNTLTQACEGLSPVVILGNEFLDALPVHVVQVSGSQAQEAWVALEETENGFVWQWDELSPSAVVEIQSLWGALDTLDTGQAQKPQSLQAMQKLNSTQSMQASQASNVTQALQTLQALQATQALGKDGILELRPVVADLLAEIEALMPSGSLLFIDYGAWGPGRGRTVRGYFHHQRIDDPLARPGHQDLTADVDFAALDMHGRDLGFETIVFTNLAAFMATGLKQAECGLSWDAGGSCSDFLENDKRATVLRALLDENDLGGEFKVILQVR